MIETLVMLHAAGAEVEALIPDVGGIHSVWKDLPFPVTLVPFAWWASRPDQATTRRWLGAMRRLIISVPHLIRIFRQRKPDLILTNTIVAPSAAIAAKLTGIDHVWFVQEMDQGAHAFTYFLGRRFSLRLVDQLSRLIIVSSRVVQDHYSAVLPSEKMRILNYAVEPTVHFPHRIDAGTDGALRLILLGALTPGKRQEDAIRAVSILRKQGIVVQLDLIGGMQNAYAARLHKLTSTLGLNDTINFVGETDRPLDHLAQSHVSLMCSQDEAFGRVTIESMKVGLAVIGARSGGTAELIADGTTGLLYEVGNADELARQIAHLDRNRYLVARIGDAARNYALKRFNNDSCLRELLAFLAEAPGQSYASVKQ